MQQVLSECMQNWWQSQTHDSPRHILVACLFLLSCMCIISLFQVIELLMARVCHSTTCYHAEITNFNISLNVSHCSHFLIQGKLISLCYFRLWTCSSGIVISASSSNFCYTSVSDNHCYGTYLHPQSFLSLSILVNDWCRWLLWVI